MRYAVGFAGIVVGLSATACGVRSSSAQGELVVSHLTAGDTGGDDAGAGSSSGTLTASGGCGELDLGATLPGAASGGGDLSVWIRMVAGFSPESNHTYVLAPYSPPTGTGCIAGEAGGGDLLYSSVDTACAFDIDVSAIGEDGHPITALTGASIAFSSFSDTSGVIALNAEVSLAAGGSVSFTGWTNAPVWSTGLCEEGPIPV
jgi:hypothetical protein